MTVSWRAVGLAGHRGQQPGAQRRAVLVPQLRQRAADRPVGEHQILGVQGLVEHRLHLLLGHRLAPDPDAGEEDLLVQPQAAAADQDEPRDGGDAGLREAVGDDRGHPVHRRVDAEQRGAQGAGGALQQRVPEVDVDQVARARPPPGRRR